MFKKSSCYIYLYSWKKRKSWFGNHIFGFCTNCVCLASQAHSTGVPWAPHQVSGFAWQFCSSAVLSVIWFLFYAQEPLRHVPAHSASHQRISFFEDPTPQVRSYAKLNTFDLETCGKNWLFARASIERAECIVLCLFSGESACNYWVMFVQWGIRLQLQPSDMWATLFIWIINWINSIAKVWIALSWMYIQALCCLWIQASC